MRSLFWALLLINIATFIWWKFIQPPHMPIIDLNTAVGGKRLVLLREVNISALQQVAAAEKKVAPPSVVNPAPAQASQQVDSAASVEASPSPGKSEAAEPSSPQPEPQCYALGPFADAKAASAAQKRLNATGVTQKLDSVARELPDGYMVFLPPSPSRQEAKKITEELAAKGESDYFIVPGGDNENAVSLGLYRDRSMADQRAEKIRKLGFEPVVNPRLRQKSELWLKYRLPVDRDLGPTFFQQLSGDAAGARSEHVACEQAGV